MTDELVCYKKDVKRQSELDGKTLSYNETLPSKIHKRKDPNLLNRWELMLSLSPNSL